MNNYLPADFIDVRYGLVTRLVDKDDAEFVVRLRTDTQKGQFLGATDADVEKQRHWIQEYKKRERDGKEYYFMFEKPKGERLGVSRIYDIKEDTFTTGSWVFKKDAPFGAAFLGDIICHEIAFELFPKSVNLHDVRKANMGVRKYADEFHPTLLFETEYTQYYMNTRENYIKYKDAYLAKFLPLIERMNKRKA
ncbi:MAG: hypothetical protein J6Y78_17130 [Paludibacteraceae bacterium]|nr:hypothetical protein [Paludibacteraceae bacterium]